MISYKLLGLQGALGNQLWEIAGTYGIAKRRGQLAAFPKWFYQPYFGLGLDLVFLDYLEGVETMDLGEDYLQNLSHCTQLARLTSGVYLLHPNTRSPGSTRSMPERISVSILLSMSGAGTT